MPFSEYAARVFPSLPAPALLHFCAFERCGAPDSPAFDCNYPDLLPPATVFGSTCDLQAMMLEAAQLGVSRGRASRRRPSQRTASQTALPLPR